MDEVVEVLMEIRDQLKGLNARLDKITGGGVYEIYDICSRVDNVESKVTDVVMAIEDLATK